jgi:hypothetical protein
MVKPSLTKDMKLVFEDEDGAYLGVRPEFLKRYVLREQNPNFEVYDAIDGHNRFIAVKSSRLPDDEDPEKGKYGIDFNRVKPGLKEALQYEAELPRGYQWINSFAFAAKNEEEYILKSRAWDGFYAYIWDTKPQTLWVAPHSGDVNRPPDDILHFPKLMIDIYTAGVAAVCALKNRGQPSKRLMMAIHNTGQLGGVLNLGDFGILNQEKMDAAVEEIESKYKDRAQVLAPAFKQDFCERTMEICISINRKRGTLIPEELDTLSYDDSLVIRFYVKGLRLYGQEIKEHTLDEFKRALDNLGQIKVPVITNNYFYTGRNVGRTLGLPEKIKQGLVDAAILIEGARHYMAKDPDLVSDIILDVKNELFS